MPAVHLAVLQGIFRSGVSLDAFCRLFYLDNSEIVTNKKRRWHVFLRAARDGSLLRRPNVAPLWEPHKLYQPQMPDRLQSGYEDVEHELVEMTKLAREHKIGVLFVAGDGLALMRLNHLLKNKRDLYMDASPVIIPIQGTCAPQFAFCAPQFRTQSFTLRQYGPMQVSIPMGSSTSCTVSGASIANSLCGVPTRWATSRLSRTRTSRN